MKDMIYRDYAFFIIGNGYDLSCGYNTSFKDYLDYISNTIKDNDYYTLDFITFVHYIYRKYNNDNDIIKLSLNDNNWADIEKNILDIENRRLVEEVQNKLNSIPVNVKSYGFDIECTLSYETDFSNRDKDLLNYVRIHYPKIIPQNFNLLGEINKFELAFKNYLKTIIATDNAENEKSKEIFNKLVSGFRSGIVFNFNYTHTIDNISNKNFEIRHVHGVIDDEIIIGVDLANVKTRKEISKTHRLLNLKKNTNYDVIPSNPKEIVFYGHSLNEQDYSYFQSIFDHVNLYNSSVRLTFYYSEFDGEEFSRQKERVIKLIEVYGNTLDNKDHGKNLLHKLLLEERILFKQI